MPDRSLFYVEIPSWGGPVYGEHRGFDDGRSHAVLISGKSIGFAVEGWIDAIIFLKPITREEFDAARSLDWPPIADVKRNLGREEIA